MPDQRDDVIDRVVDELSTLPPVEEAAIQRILAAAEAQRHRSTQPTPQPAAAEAAPIWRRRWLRYVPPLALAATLGAVMWIAAPRADRADVLASRETAVSSRTGGVPTGTGGEARTQAVAAADDMPIATEFSLYAPNATKVVVVGSFNDWNASAMPLTRVDGTGLWTLTVPLAQGRHIYAFVVDDTVWTLDPRAPRAADPDFGTEGSTILVGQP